MREDSQCTEGLDSLSDGPQQVARNVMKLKREKCRVLGLWNAGTAESWGWGWAGWRESLQERTFRSWWQQVKQPWVVSPYDDGGSSFIGQYYCTMARARDGIIAPCLGIVWLCLENCIWLWGSSVQREKQKNQKVSQWDTRMFFLTSSQGRNLFLFGLMKRRLQKDLISVFSHKKKTALLFFGGALGETERL